MKHILTLADIAGAKLPGVKIDGHSFAGQMKSQDKIIGDTPPRKKKQKDKTEE